MSMNVMGKGFIKPSMLPTKISSCHQASLRHTYTPARVRLCSEHRRLWFPCSTVFIRPSKAFAALILRFLLCTNQRSGKNLGTKRLRPGIWGNIEWKDKI